MEFLIFSIPRGVVKRGGRMRAIEKQRFIEYVAEIFTAIYDFMLYYMTTFLTTERSVTDFLFDYQARKG